jgi:hypothetical protein
MLAPIALYSLHKVCNGLLCCMQVAYLGAWLALCPRLPWGTQQQAAALQTARTALERYGSCSEPVSGSGVPRCLLDVIVFVCCFCSAA